jgi:hypothetical protein
MSSDIYSRATQVIIDGQRVRIADLERRYDNCLSWLAICVGRMHECGAGVPLSVTALIDAGWIGS